MVSTSDHSDSSKATNDTSRDMDGGEPWKTLLEMPARAAWRVSSPRPPTALENAQRQVLQRTKGHYNQTLKHLKQVHESVIQSHKDLALRRHRERTRMMLEKEPTKSDERRDSKHQPVLYGPEETLASLKFRLYPNFSVVKRVLLETRSLLGGTSHELQEWKPKHVLDFGIGCGSASAAVLNVWDNDVDWIHGVDPSEAMRNGAQAIIESYSQEQRNGNLELAAPRLTLAAHLSSEIAPPSFDMVLFTHTATELPHGTSILAAAAVLWDKLRPNGLFVMIEPGTPDGFSSVRMVRNMLLDCATPDAEDGGFEKESCCIIAPCTHNGACPMEQYPDSTRSSTQIDVTDAHDRSMADVNQVGGASGASSRKGFCSFVQTMPGYGGSTRGEKFSYLVVQKRVLDEQCDVAHSISAFDGLAGLLNQGTHGSSSQSVSAHSLATDMEARYIESNDDDLGLEILRGDRNRHSFGRIVRSPLKKKGHIHIDYCRSPGRMERHVVSKSMSKRVPGVYAAARKARWGGFWPAHESNSIDKS